MDERSQAYLNQILSKDPETLTEEEIGFLRARRTYLKAIQLEEYASVLSENQTSNKTETVKTTNANTK